MPRVICSLPDAGKEAPNLDREGGCVGGGIIYLPIMGKYSCCYRFSKRECVTMKGHSEYTLGYLWVAYCTNNHFLKPFWCILERINASSHSCVLHSRTYIATKTRGVRCPKKELTNATWMFFCRVRERQRKVRATVAPQTNL